MSLWLVAPIAERPSVSLRSWQVFDVPLSGETWTRHFVGYAVEDRQGQVSSPVLTFSPAERCGVTRSGRVYQLIGRPGADSDAEYVWNRWKRLWDIAPEGVRNVTSEVWSLIMGEASEG